MELKEQRYIVTLARYKSITRAAKELNITQAALSIAVKNIETYTGTKLFERTKKEVIPTPAGEIYLESARSILEEDEIFEKRLKEYLDHSCGRICFGINSRRSPYIVPKLLVQMKKKYPRVEISVKESDTKKLEAMLNNNELDCIWTYRQIQHGDINSELLGEDAVGFIIGDHNIHLRQAETNPVTQKLRIDPHLLADEIFLLYENDETRDDFEHLALHAGFHPKTEEFYNVETMLRLVEYNYGVMYMNESYAMDYNDNHQERPLYFLNAGTEKAELRMYLSYHKRLCETGYGRDFIEYTRNITSNNFDARRI